MSDFFGYSSYSGGFFQLPYNSYADYDTDNQWVSYGSNQSTQDLINYYANLLILQYIGKPKAFATIQLLVTPIVMNQLPIQVQNAFNPATAVGVQLDVLGKYAGVTRSGYGLQGQAITLDDSDFAKLIQMATISNVSGSSLFDIQKLLQVYFAGEVFVFDYANMQMSYLITTAVDLNLVELFITEGLLPKPMGVQLASVIYGPNVGDFFGFRTYLAANPTASPLNTYADYHTDFPFLSYEDVL